MIATSAYLVWRLARGDARLETDAAWERLRRPPSTSRRALPAGLGPGRIPTRRDVTVALLVALAVLVTRGYRLDWPRDMYFDEVYHARTAYELLAQREPYEWTHPHLAKEIMALGILAFADDRVVGTEPANSQVRAFAVANDGLRAVVEPDALVLRDRSGRQLARAPITNLDRPDAVGFDGEDVVLVTEFQVARLGRDGSVKQRVRLTTMSRSAPRSLVIENGRIVIAGDGGIEIYQSLETKPQVIPTPVVAATAKTDGSVVYAVDQAGVVHVI